MGQKVPHSVSFNLPDGREVTLETGKLAALADGSAVVRCGDTMLLATAVSAKEAREGQSFFPLSVDYQEKFAAAGRIPGNFFRREARLSEYEILTSRLVDRALRPLFPDGYLHDTQIIINLISGDPETLPDAFACLAAATALSVSPIPFSGPISEVRVAKINGKYVINPDRSDLLEASLELIVAANENDINMVEGEGKEVQEQELVEAIKVAHDAIKVQIEAQKKLAQLVGEKALVKREFVPEPPEEWLTEFVKDFTSDKVSEVARGALDKESRKAQLDAIKSLLKEAVEAERGEEYLKEHGSMVSAVFDKNKKKVIRELVMAERLRLDGRDPTEVRNIWTEVDYLPAAHGSAIFTRGETQALTSLILGSKKDELMVDNALAPRYDKFLLHYNFPAFSVNETKPMRGPGRREVGHANLAGRSLRQVLPEVFPYTIRIVSDILESNGSSSMATVCAGSLALMDAGVPTKASMAGIAMGLITDGDRTVILSDILGDEDALGDMDFKVTGTKDGICGCQMDMKIDGLKYETLEEALEQARQGRLHILGEMDKTIIDPREDIKAHAPRIVELRVDKSFIGPIIGPGGKIIQEIQAETGTTISIEEEGNQGVVNIFGPNKQSVDDAKARIDEITFVPSVGDEFDAVVESIQPYGAFVKFSGVSGLLHISEISWERLGRVEDVLSEGDTVRVKLIGVDPKSGKFRLSRKVLLPKPDGYVERPPREDRGGRDNRRGGGDRRRHDNRRDN